MGNADDIEKINAWETAFKEQLGKHPDPARLQQGVVKILLDMLQPPPGPAKAVSREERRQAKRFLFTGIFGDVPRVRIIEALVSRPSGWYNLADLAAVTGAGKATVKRVVDELLARGNDLTLVEEHPREEHSQERLVKLADTPAAHELRFLHVKLRGIL